MKEMARENREFSVSNTRELLVYYIDCRMSQETLKLPLHA